MPYLFGSNNNLFKYLSLFMVLYRKTVKILNIQLSTDLICNEHFKALLRDQLQNTFILSFVAHFFNISEEVAYTCLINSASTFLIKFGIEVAQSTVSAFTSSPLALLTYIISGVKLSDGANLKLNLERELNVANALVDLYMCMLENPEIILESNTLLLAIDERNFNIDRIISHFRRNDGTLCKFLYIEELSGAPKARNTNGPHPIAYYLDIFRSGNSNEIDLDELINALR